jgi:SAM-dependent methyltransferase
MDHYIRKDCRLCGSQKLEKVLSLNNSALCDVYLKKPEKQEFYPLGLNLCMDCSFVQLSTVVNPEVIYRDYIYVTISSSGLEKHFSNYCSYVCDYLSFKENQLIVDIGSNDGTLLKNFKKKNHRVIGVEPASEISKNANAKGIKTYPQFFDKDLAKRIVSKDGYADLVTVNNLFANIDDLHNFIQAVGVLLSKDGVLVIESSYLYYMLENMVFDFIYHEHLSYLSATPLQAFMRIYGMHLIHIQGVPTKGGSLRYFFARINSEWSIDDSVQKILRKEFLNNELRSTFKQFAGRIEKEKKKIRHYLTSINARKVAGYGASATSTTLISHFGLDEYIDFLVDDNPSKVNTYSPGYHIPVYSSEKIRQDSLDVLIILAWRFKDEIMGKMKDLSCKVVVPLPEFKVVR